MYEMLCGYNLDQIGRTEDQLKSGSLARLIDWLAEDSLDYRVLAVYDLLEITGKQLMPNPAGSLAERERNIKQWRSRLESGDLRPLAAEAAPEASEQ
jgi:DNA invertase Pin-like site-specific DNA recombinase